MPNYRRNRTEGGCYFFTVNLLVRKQNPLLVNNIDLLRDVVRRVRTRYPFHIDGWVILPDHMHCIWTLPKGDTDYSNRMRLIKGMFSRGLPKDEWLSPVRHKKGERGIWQRRFWEHTIYGDEDYAAHMDYLHYNPVKHHYVEHVKEWPHSTFHRLVNKDVYPLSWGAVDVSLSVGEPG